jgi:hypothetical protein
MRLAALSIRSTSGWLCRAGFATPAVYLLDPFAIAQWLWGWVETVGPDNRSSFVVGANLAEVVGVAQGLTERAAQQEAAGPPRGRHRR